MIGLAKFKYQIKFVSRTVFCSRFKWNGRNRNIFVITRVQYLVLVIISRLFTG